MLDERAVQKFVERPLDLPVGFVIMITSSPGDRFVEGLSRSGREPPGPSRMRTLDSRALRARKDLE